MFTMRKRAVVTLAGATAAALALAACSPATKSTETSGDTTTVTFRLWDETAKPAYEESFKQFMAENSDINVKIELVSWDKYWDQLPLDISSGDMADIYWVNSSNYAKYVENGNLMNISEVIGNEHDAWQQSAVDLYTRNGSIWGVPQLWDSIALYYNKDLVQAAGVDVNSLTWAANATAGDTLLAAATKLTTDAAGRHANAPDFDATSTKVYGFNSQADLQAIYLPFVAEAGGSYQSADDKIALASDSGVTAFQYLIDLINKYHVAPPASETNTNGDSTRDMFLQGQLALYQSGPYNLKNIAESGTKVNWGIAPMIAGPNGRVSTVHSVVAVGNAQTKHKDATERVLRWLGSTNGQMALGSQGVAFPGVVNAQQAFVDYWQKKGVDVSVFINAANGSTMKPPVGVSANAQAGALSPILLDTFLGTYSVKEGLTKAQEAGNAAMEG